MTTKNKLAVFCCWPYGETMGVWDSSALVMPLGLDGPSLLQYYPSVTKKKKILAMNLVYVWVCLFFLQPSTSYWAICCSALLLIRRSSLGFKILTWVTLANY